MIEKVTLYPLQCKECNNVIGFGDWDNSDHDEIIKMVYCKRCTEITIKEKSKDG